MLINNTAKLIAIYFTQLHEIDENNKWWGDGFTDWINVKTAQPLYEGHYQPRIPLDHNYYDQSKIETLHWQVEIAKKYGIYGFCHYHYWFDGKQLLETPTNLMLQNKDINMPFCLSWANETWSKRWDGNDHHTLIKQTHPPSKDRWKLHFNYLIKAWTDERHIKIDNKPIFVIYRPHHIPKINQMLNYWKDLARAEGLEGIYFIAQKQYEFPNQNCLNCFDAVFQFQPFESIYSPTFNKSSIKHSNFFKFIRAIPAPLQDKLRAINAKLNRQKITFYDYEEVWNNIIQNVNTNTITTFPGAFMDWDNTSRYKNRGTILNGANPKSFEYYFEKLVRSLPKRNIPEPIIFVNAWNEWAESAYLEPDEKHGFEYLEAIRRVIVNNK